MRTYLFRSMPGHARSWFLRESEFLDASPYGVQFHADDVADPRTNHAKEIPRKSRKPTPRLASGVTVPSFSQAQTPLSSF